MVCRLLPHLGLMMAIGLMSAGCTWGQDPGDAARSNAAEAEGSQGEAEDGPDDMFAGVDDEQPSAADEEPPAGQPPVDNAADSEGPALGREETVAATDADDRVHQLNERITALETEIESLRATIDSLEQVVASLEDLDDPERFRREALGAMAEDAELRGNLGQMLQGKVRLMNDTGAEQVLYINGTPWTVVTGESYVYAPVGTVSFLHRRDGEPEFKGIQEWTENLATGQMELEYRLSDQPAASETSVLSPLVERQP